MTKPKKKSRDIKFPTALHVYTAAAGRCSFFGCSKYVLEEPLTHNKAVLGNIAHIVAASEDGPRGNYPLSMSERSKFENLMLLCPVHHPFIDKKEYESEYTVELLREWKKRHESRMKMQTGIPATAKSYALRFHGQVRENRFTISEADMNPAVFKYEKRYIDEKIFDIDLINIPDTATKSYWKTGKGKIDLVLQQELMPMIESGKVERLSIFALARIPLLAYLGYKLGDKVPSKLYQKHKDDGEGWIWPSNQREIKFERLSHSGDSTKKIAILISVSGGEVDKVRLAVPENRIYEIRPIGETPRYTLIRSPKTLENFRLAYRDFLSYIESAYPHAEQIDCFIAGPAPVALICGRELRAEDPIVIIHDLVDNAYKPAITLE